jgi:hypothetical protein
MLNTINVDNFNTQILLGEENGTGLKVKKLSYFLRSNFSDLAVTVHRCSMTVPSVVQHLSRLYSSPGNTYISMAGVTASAGTSLARGWVMVVCRQHSLSTPIRRNPTTYSEVAK